MSPENRETVSEGTGNEEDDEFLGTAQEDGSSPQALWQGFVGTVLGLLFLPLVAWGVMRVIQKMVGTGTPVPFWLWGGGFCLTLLVGTALGLRLRRISDMCAVAYAVTTFFSVLVAVGMMTQLSPLMLPKLSLP